MKTLKKSIARKQLLLKTHALYKELTTQARENTFFVHALVPDTLDGRFEMIALHMALLLYRFKKVPPSAPAFAEIRSLGQSLYDMMFADFDLALREMGVGDLGVSRRVKEMVKAFHGRLNAYDAAFEGKASLQEVLRRNVYGTVTNLEETALTVLKDYVVEVLSTFLDIPEENFLHDVLTWPHPLAVPLPHAS